MPLPENPIHTPVSPPWGGQSGMSYRFQRFMLVTSTPEGGENDHQLEGTSEGPAQRDLFSDPHDQACIDLNVSHSQVVRYLLEKYLVDLEGEAELTKDLLRYYLHRLDVMQGILGSEE